MGELGAGTRICGGEFGSVLTFASGKEASAPGQMDAKVLHAYLVQYYRKDNRRQSKVSDDENDTN